MKYLFAYSIPITAFIGFYHGGWGYWATPLFAFVIIPILEMVMPLDTTNLEKEEALKNEKKSIYDVMLYANIVIVYGLLFWSFTILNTTKTWLETAGLIFSLGLVLGTNGINVAHELGHRSNFIEKILAKALLLPSFYTHFFIEHNHGHHVHVSTPEDPSTAKFNQSLYWFWIQTVVGTYTKAWKIQKQINQRENIRFFSPKNDMFWFSILQLTFLLAVYLLFGGKGVLFAISVGIIGFLLLETINYIEHYGLRRRKLTSGRYERVSEIHSWNSNHIMGRIILYELTRHSDHHFKSNKKYQILEYHQSSPQLPFGYPTSMVLAAIPPLWFSIMNPRIPAEMVDLAENN
ncbi:MAG: alkane 1-monooxygenase [Flavobacterium sp.]